MKCGRGTTLKTLISAVKGMFCRGRLRQSLKVQGSGRADHVTLNGKQIVCLGPRSLACFVSCLFRRVSACVSQAGLSPCPCATALNAKLQRLTPVLKLKTRDSFSFILPQTSTCWIVFLSRPDAFPQALKTAGAQAQPLWNSQDAYAGNSW